MDRCFNERRRDNCKRQRRGIFKALQKKTAKDIVPKKMTNEKLDQRLDEIVGKYSKPVAKKPSNWKKWLLGAGIVCFFAAGMGSSVYFEAKMHRRIRKYSFIYTEIWKRESKHPANNIHIDDVLHYSISPSDKRVALAVDEKQNTRISLYLVNRDGTYFKSIAAVPSEKEFREIYWIDKDNIGIKYGKNEIMSEKLTVDSNNNLISRGAQLPPPPPPRREH
jgi:hypothetical protein